MQPTFTADGGFPGGEPPPPDGLSCHPPAMSRFPRPHRAIDLGLACLHTGRGALKGSFPNTGPAGPAPRPAGRRRIPRCLPIFRNRCSLLPVNPALKLAPPPDGVPPAQTAAPSVQNRSVVEFSCPGPSAVFPGVRSSQFSLLSSVLRAVLPLWQMSQAPDLPAGLSLQQMSQAPDLPAGLSLQHKSQAPDLPRPRTSGRARGLPGTSQACFPVVRQSLRLSSARSPDPPGRVLAGFSIFSLVPRFRGAPPGPDPRPSSGPRRHRPSKRGKDVSSACSKS
jgi:hypothetical protein